ncbi:PAS domain-containing protein [Sphingomonas sp. Xoc002]|uniref:PAS domain-containing protein n=1 Tax=Sphingomonas sp. Xoc002 TaxID=2837624 RepID=UPI003D1781B1
MAAQIRARDWGATPLGPVTCWPQSLKTIVDLMLGSPSMMSLVWGAEAIHLYNDRFTELLREHHVQALGQSAFVTFARSRDVFAADVASGMSGQSARLLAQKYPVLRHGELKDAWFDVDYAPVRDETGKIAGVLWTLREVTAQVLAERALRESETRHRLLIGSWAQAVWETDPNGVVVTDSPSWRSYTGQTLEEWLGYGWLDAIHPDDKGYAERQWRDAIAAQRLVDAEFRLRAPDGEWRWTNVRAAPVIDADGQIEKWLGLNIDIDDRKLAESALRESEERQAFQLQLSDALAPLTDPADIQAEAMRLLAERLDAAWCYFNEFDARGTHAVVLCDFHRNDLPSMVGVHDLSGERKFLDLVHSGTAFSFPAWENFEHFSASAAAAYRNLGMRSAAGVPLLRNGRLAAVLLAAGTRVRDWSFGDIELLKGAAERIWIALERARIEQTLRQSEERLRNVLEGMAEGFGVLAPDFTIIEHNAEALRLDGRARDEVVGRSHWDAYPESEDSELGRRLKAAMADRCPVSLEHQYAWKDGRALWLEMRAHPMVDGGLAVFWRDVTDRRHADDALRESEERYRTLFESMDEACAVVEVLRDDTGRWADFRFIDVNHAFLKHTTMPWPVGKTATELLGKPNPRWTELYGEALDSGKPLRVEESEATLGITFDLNIFSLDPARNRVAVLFTNITERKRAETALRESEERQSFLLNLSDAVRPLAAPADIQGETTRLLREVLGAGWCYYVDWDLDRSTGLVLRDSVRKGLPSLAGAHDVSDAREFLQLLAIGEALTVRDYATYERLPARIRQNFTALGFRSMMAAPLVKEGRLIATLLVGDTKVRAWSPSEASLLVEVAERTWATLERARAEAALRESEQRFQEFASASAFGLWIRNAETLAMEYTSPAIASIYGVEPDALLGDVSRWTGIIHSDDRDVARQHLEQARLGETIVHEFRIRRASDHAIRWIRNTDFPLYDGDQVWRIGGIAEDITEGRSVQQELEHGAERLRNAVEVGRVGLWDWNIVTGDVHWSDEHFRMQGYAAGEVAPSYEAWASRLHAEDRAGAEAALRQAMADHQEFVREFRAVHPDGSVHWHSARGRFFYDDRGEAIRMIGAMVDTTERREWEERQKVLVNELQHRTRNLMGVVRSMSDKTARASADLPDFRTRFRDRLEALSRVQGLLSRLEDHDRVTFDDLIRTELSVMDGTADRVTLSGREGIRLRSSTVQTLAMALHELTTNAMKYGALGQSAGKLAITWSLQNEGDRPWLHIDWRESGVAMAPAGAAPRGTGQGRELIEKALPYQLQAKTSYLLGSDGVHCTIAVPVSTSSGEVEDHG